MDELEEMIDKKIDEVSKLALFYCEQGDQVSSERWIGHYIAYTRVKEFIRTKKETE